MEDFLQSVASGVVIGGIYALIAMGFVVIYKATGIINFAIGEFMMLGAFFCFTAMTAAKFPFAASLLAAVAGAAALGVLVERFILRPLHGQGHDLDHHGDDRPLLRLQGGRPARLVRRLPRVPADLPAGADTAGEHRDPVPPVLLLPDRHRCCRPDLARVPVHADRDVSMRATANDQAAAFSMGIDIRRVFSPVVEPRGGGGRALGGRDRDDGGNQPPAGGHRAQGLPGRDPWRPGQHRRGAGGGLPHRDPGKPCGGIPGPAGLAGGSRRWRPSSCSWSS